MCVSLSHLQDPAVTQYTGQTATASAASAGLEEYNPFADGDLGRSTVAVRYHAGFLPHWVDLAIILLKSVKNDSLLFSLLLHFAIISSGARLHRLKSASKISCAR